MLLLIRLCHRQVWQKPNSTPDYVATLSLMIKTETKSLDNIKVTFYLILCNFDPLGQGWKFPGGFFRTAAQLNSEHVDFNIPSLPGEHLKTAQRWCRAECRFENEINRYLPELCQLGAVLLEEENHEFSPHNLLAPSPFVILINCLAVTRRAPNRDQHLTP